MHTPLETSVKLLKIKDKGENIAGKQRKKKKYIQRNNELQQTSCQRLYKLEDNGGTSFKGWREKKSYPQFHSQQKYLSKMKVR